MIPDSLTTAPSPEAPDSGRPPKSGLAPALAFDRGPAPSNDSGCSSPYARYAEVFSSVYNETRSIEIALEVVDTFRTREAILPPLVPDLPGRIVEVVAQIFSVKPKQLFERNRQHDVTSARYVAAWLLLRRRWKKVKIASFFKLDHSTVIHGLRLVVANVDLLAAAHRAEQLLDPGEARPLVGLNPSKDTERHA